MQAPKIKIVYLPEKGLYQIKDPIGGMEFSGTLETQNIAFSHHTTTTDYTVGNNAVVFADASSTNINLSMPNAQEYNGVVFRIKKIDSTGNFVNVLGTFGQTIDGESSLQINSQNTTVTLMSNGQNWYII